MPLAFVMTSIARFWPTLIMPILSPWDWAAFFTAGQRKLVFASWTMGPVMRVGSHQSHSHRPTEGKIFWHMEDPTKSFPSYLFAKASPVFNYLGRTRLHASARSQYVQDVPPETPTILVFRSIRRTSLLEMKPAIFTTTLWNGRQTGR